MKAECKHCQKIFFRPTPPELGERMKQHLEKKHPDLLGAELVKAQLLVGLMITRHFKGEPDLENVAGNDQLRDQLIEMLQGKRVFFEGEPGSVPSLTTGKPDGNVIEIKPSSIERGDLIPQAIEEPEPNPPEMVVATGLESRPSGDPAA